MQPSKGLSVTRMPMQGWWLSDTARVRLEGVRVPLGNMLGKEGEG